MRGEAMQHYLEIHLRPDAELAPHQILGALYARLHRALVRLASEDIGVSFPDYDARKPALGTRLRLHGPQPSLRGLMATPWLDGMQDHLRLTPIAPAPAATQHCRVTRVQAKSSPSRLRRRAMRRHGCDAETADRNFPDSAAQRLPLPFLVLGSRSTGQPSFPLFIRQSPPLAQPVPGTFNSYGLSPQATIPWF